MLRVAAVGTASTGKSALLNALFGTTFLVDARAGSTTAVERVATTFDQFDVDVIDTPPLDEPEDPVHADVYLLVCDKDLTDVEHAEAARIALAGRPLLVLVNKADTYNDAQRYQLLGHIVQRLQELVPASRIMYCAADPVRLVSAVQPDGELVERTIPAPPQLQDVLPALRVALNEARTSLRVQTREYAREAADRVKSAANSGWRLLRDRARKSGF